MVVKHQNSQATCVFEFLSTWVAAARSAKTKERSERTWPAGIDISVVKDGQAFLPSRRSHEPQHETGAIDSRKRQGHASPSLIDSSQRNICIADIEDWISGTSDAVWPSGPSPR